MIEIAVKNSKPFLVGYFYRPPETCRYLSESYNFSVQSHLSDVLKESKEAIMLGDFNVSYKNLYENTELKTTRTLNGFKQLIKKPTRITQTSSTLIDLIVTNRPLTISKTDVIASSLSNHDMIACIREVNSQKFAPKTIKCRNYANYEPNNLNEDISKIDWQPLDGTTDVSAAL